MCRARQAFHVEHKAREIRPARPEADTLLTARPSSSWRATLACAHCAYLARGEPRAMDVSAHLINTQTRDHHDNSSGGSDCTTRRGRWGTGPGLPASHNRRRPLRDQAEDFNTAAVGRRHHGVIEREAPDTRVAHLYRAYRPHRARSECTHRLRAIAPRNRQGSSSRKPGPL